MYCCGKQEINFAIFPFILKVSLRGAVPSLLDGHDALAVLDSVEFYFPSLCNCSWNGTRETSNRVGFLSPVEHHQRQEIWAFQPTQLPINLWRSWDLICKLLTTIVVHGPGQVPGTTNGEKTWVISDERLWKSSFHDSFVYFFFFENNCFDLETRLTVKQLY